MYTGTHSIKVIFEKDQRLLVPLFQRPYVWGKALQWEPLWDDIRKVAERHLRAETPRPHFLGAVVLDQIKQPIGRVDSRLVIDGQQRLTTIQLFVEAFADICAELEQGKYHKALLKLTRNDNPLSEDENDIYKIWPTNSDQESFKQVMQVSTPAELRQLYKAKPDATSVGHAIADCYLYFHAEISSWLALNLEHRIEKIDALYKTICEYLRMVVIELDKDDDAQLIFETLNARGTPLLPSDLVKNFLFHKAEMEGEKIETLYKKYWKHFDDESAYWRKEIGIGHAKRARIDLFLQHFLTLKMRDEVPSGHIYTTYRQHILEQKDTKASVHLQSLKKYADIYKTINTLPRNATRTGISLLWLDILGLSTIYPFLMELFSRYELDHPEIEKTLLYVESYLVRRMVCLLSTRGFNRIFMDLLVVFSDDAMPVSDKVFETLSAFDAETNRWPREAEFKQSWMERPLYNLLRQQRIALVLESLERRLHTSFTESIDIKQKLTIEHIMPQDWRKHWPLTSDLDTMEALEGNRNRLIHTVGNLTLITGSLNPSISNSIWDIKREGIKTHSILLLNKDVENSQEWDEQTIMARGEKLFGLAQKIWPEPSTLYSVDWSEVHSDVENESDDISERELADRHIKRLEFWAGLLELAKVKTPNFAHRVPKKQYWIPANSGVAGFIYSYVIRMDNSQIELYIDPGDAQVNKRIFEQIFAQKEQIEKVFGKPLIWQKLDHRRACRVCYTFNHGGLLDEDLWPEIQNSMVDGMVDFQKAIQPVINEIQ